MKNFRNHITSYLTAFFLALALAFGFNPPKAAAQAYGSIGYQDFYDDLAPYGQWFNDPQYGYVWTPNNVGRDFRPYYTNGYWAMTDYGNMWMSNYAWGWAPFHYGRWALTNYGWVWIPGNEWGPAWVTWRQGGGYYGWAPMGPGVSINISFGNSYYAPDPWWTFIPCGHIYNRGFHRYHNPRRNNTYVRNTTIINNSYYDNRSRNTYVTGPRRSDVERTTGRRVDVYQVNNRSRAGRSEQSGRTVSVYRPQVKAGAASVKQAAPRTVKQVDRATSTSRQNTAVRSQDAQQNKATPRPSVNKANKATATPKVSPRTNTQPAKNQQIKATRPQQQRAVQQQQVQQRQPAVRQQASPQRQQQAQRQQVQRPAQRSSSQTVAPQRAQTKSAPERSNSSSRSTERSRR